MQQKSLPPEWIEKIFMRLHGRFGNAFLAKFRIGHIDQATGEDVGILNAKQVWAEELAHLSPERITRALQAKYDYAPSSDDFVKAATPTPACHRDNTLLALPRPKMEPEKVRSHLQRLWAAIKGKKTV